MSLAQAQSAQHLDLSQDNFLDQLRRAADSLRAHPLRIVDSASSQELKGVGPVISRVRAAELLLLRLTCWR